MNIGAKRTKIILSMGKLSDFLESVASGKESHYDMMDFIKSVYSDEDKKDLDLGIEELCNKYNWDAMKLYQKDEINENEISVEEQKASNINRFRQKWNNYKNTVSTSTIENGKIPTLTLIYNTDIDNITKVHEALRTAKFINPDINSWLYWFYSDPSSKSKQTFKPKQIEWLQSIPELLYLMECICPDGFPKTENRKIKELNQIFKTPKGIVVDSYHKSTTNQLKKNSIKKIIN